MLAWLKFLPLLPQLVSLVKSVLELVRVVEDALAGKVPGPGKKQVALDIIRTSVGVAQKLGIKEAAGIDANQLVAAADPLIDAVVATLNAAGVFKHGAPPAPAP